MRLKYLVFISLFWSSTLSAQDTIVKMMCKQVRPAQYRLHGLVDVGYNFVEQTYGNFGVIGAYRYKKKWDFEMGLCMTTAPIKQFNFKSLRLTSYYNIVKHPNIGISISYLWNPSTYYENHIHHLVLAPEFRSNHVDFFLGFHYRHLHFFKRLEYQNPRDNMFNIVYKLELSVRHAYQYNSFWNIKAAVKNMDYFDYTRWSQPMFSISAWGYYSRIECYLEFLVKPSGFLNMVINRFDYKVRTGIIWYI